ncbi:hypothetical protein, partial [Bradyrhizobium sp.]|uniref:hypothetical protein n=1 Tax=Bradyrhizobium sp. TaxID=376 RepID=UPI0028FE7FB6
SRPDHGLALGHSAVLFSGLWHERSCVSMSDSCACTRDQRGDRHCCAALLNRRNLSEMTSMS